MLLTLDTNCLINHFDTESPTATSRKEIAELIRHAENGRVQIVITTRVEGDLDQDRDEVRRLRIRQCLSTFEVIGSPPRWDESSWDGGDFWADNQTQVLSSAIQNVLFPNLSQNDRRFGNKIRDIDHITAHAMAQRNIFVTDDGELNRRAEELRKLGIVVMRPAACLARVEAIEPLS